MRDANFRERERHGMRVKDFERKRECAKREEKRERGRGKHMNGVKV
jgi:hypothetical protein